MWFTAGMHCFISGTSYHFSEKGYRWLAPGGQILISDYCRKKGELSEASRKYIEQRDYHLTDVESYRNLLIQAGFTDVAGGDENRLFLDVLRRELGRLEENKISFVQALSVDDYKALEDGWTEKIKRAESGEQTWSVFIAKKPFR